MEETKNYHQSPSVWGSTQDLASWGIDDHEKGEGISPELHGRNLLMIPTQLGPQSPRKPLVTHYAVMDSNPVAPARSPCSRRHMYRPVWRLLMHTWMFQRRFGRRWCGQMRPKLSSLASTGLAVFGEREIMTITPRTPSPPSSMEVDTLGFGGFSLLRGQDDFTASGGP